MPLPTAVYTTTAGPPVVVNFRLLLQGNDFAREAVVTVDHIPGGDINVVSVAGKMLPTITGPCWWANYADFTAMRDNVGTAALLTTGESVVTYTVILEKVNRQRAMGGTGGIFGTVAFLNVI